MEKPVMEVLLPDLSDCNVSVRRVLGDPATIIKCPTGVTHLV